MKASTKKLLSFVFLLFTLGLVLYLGFSGNDITALWGALKQLSWVYLLLCLLCWVCYALLDALSLYYFLKKQGYPLPFAKVLYVSVIGIYYCNITPGASGGQPMQIYEFKKRGVPIGISGSALTIKFFCFQLMLLVVGTILWLFQPAYVASQVGGVTWVILMGYLFNFLSIGILLTMAISKRAVRTIITLCIRIGVRLHICKDPEKSTIKWEANCDSFLSSVQLIRSRPKELMVQFGIALLQLFALMCVVPAIYYAFGLSGASMLQQLTISVLLYISASYTPLPGASGAQEGGFAVFFAGIFPPAFLFVSLLIWRFFTYYLSLFVGAFLTLGQSLRGLGRKKNITAEAASPSQREGVPHQDNPV